MYQYQVLPRCKLLTRLVLVLVLVLECSCARARFRVRARVLMLVLEVLCVEDDKYVLRSTS